jgi:uridine kinase
LNKDAHVIALPMDGFHYPNSYLDTHTRRLSDGTEIPLSSVKGQPDTIDVNRLRRYMNALVKRPEYIPWPGYSRAAHDVLPGKYHVHMSMNLILIEGNYLLVNRGAFAGLPEMFHLRVYIDAPAPKIIANLVERHIQGGKTIDEAKDWVKRIDLPNARIAESSKANADVVIERDSDNDIAAVFWDGQELTPRPAAPLPFAVEHVPLPAHDVPHGQGDAPTAPAAPATAAEAPATAAAVISAASAESLPTDAAPGQT